MGNPPSSSEANDNMTSLAHEPVAPPGDQVDLETPAISLCPLVAEVLAELRQTEAELVRMSGSGATCFALFRSRDVMRKAAEKLAFRRPDWWQMQGSLR